MAAISASRRGDVIDAFLVRATLHMMKDLGINSTTVYVEEFEAPFLAQTKQARHSVFGFAHQYKLIYQSCSFITTSPGKNLLTWLATSI